MSTVAAARDVTRRGGPHLVSGRGVWLLAGVLALAGLVSVAASIGVGAVAVPLDRVGAVLAAHLLPGDRPVDAVDDQIVWQLRAPRAMLAVLVGAGLAVAGTALQALERNPLADPYVLGVASGASLGAVAVLALGAAALAGAGPAAGAFTGAMAAMLAVFAMARRGGSCPPGRRSGVDSRHVTVAAHLAVLHLRRARTPLLVDQDGPAHRALVALTDLTAHDLLPRCFSRANPARSGVQASCPCRQGRRRLSAGRVGPGSPVPWERACEPVRVVVAEALGEQAQGLVAARDLPVRAVPQDLHDPAF